MVGFRGTALPSSLILAGGNELLSPPSPSTCTDDDSTSSTQHKNLLPTIRHDENELEDVQWFHKSQVATTFEQGPGSTALGYTPQTTNEASFHIPGRASLARLLISHWVNE
jgi:hypothetical protein